MKKNQIIDIQNQILKSKTITTKKGLKEMNENIERVCNRLNGTLLEFKNTYLEDFANWNFRQMEIRLETMIKENGKIITKKYGSRSYTETINNDVMIKHFQITLSRRSLLLLEFLNDGEENYNTKFKNLIVKLFEYDFEISHSTKIEKIKSGSMNEFEILFTNENENKQIHARIIYACGTVNAPHYRFITTQRKIK